MDNNRIDHLFQKKLSEMEITPSVRAYNQFESYLARKTRIVFYRYAAAVAGVLIILSGSLVILRMVNTPGQVAGRDPVSEEQNTNLMKPLEKSDQGVMNPEEKKETYVVKGGLTALKEKDVAEKQPARPKEPEFIPGSVTPHNMDSIILPEEEHGLAIHEWEPILQEPDTTIINPDPPAEIFMTAMEQEEEVMMEAGITIEYIAESKPVKGKKLKGTISKIYNRTRHMKSPEEIYGDIRSFKDEIFAFNFIKNKNETNSK